MTQKKLNALGLILGIVGVIVMFKWGPPQPNLDAEVYIAAGGKDEATESKRTVYEVMSRIGLGLVGLGFLCQLRATFLRDGVAQAERSDAPVEKSDSKVTEEMNPEVEESTTDVRNPEEAQPAGPDQRR